jgi:hypothetical protein
MKVQIVTPYRVSHLQRYGVTERGNVTSVVTLQVCTHLYVGGRSQGLMRAGKLWCVVTTSNFCRACDGNQFLSCVGGWVALFIGGIRAYEISDDVTKFYARRTVSDVVIRCDPSA